MCVDSRMTSPWCPVSVSTPEPGIRLAFDHTDRAAARGAAAQAERDARPPGAAGYPGPGRIGCAEHAGEGRRRDLDQRVVALCAAAHHLAAHRAERAGHFPDSGRAGVAADDRFNRFGSETHVVGRQPVERELEGQQVVGRDDALLRLGVPGQPDDGHPLAQHRRDRPEVGRGRHEESSGQVEGQVEIVVAERRAGAGSSSSTSAAAAPASSTRSTSSRTKTGLRTPTRRSSSTMRPGPAGAGAAQRRRAEPAADHPSARAPERGGEQARQRRLADPRGPARQSAGDRTSGCRCRIAM